MVEKQSRFVKTVSTFIQKSTEMGYLFSFGEAKRPQIVADAYANDEKGISRSNHIISLAIDLNAFINYNGKLRYLDGNPHNKPEEKWQIPYLEKLGKLWESLDADCAWGGRFRPNIDYNHYSFQHNGVR